MLDVVSGAPNTGWTCGLYDKRSDNVVSIDSANDEDQENSHQTVLSTQKYVLRNALRSYYDPRTWKERWIL